MSAVALPAPPIWLPRRRPWWRRPWTDAEIREEVRAAIAFDQNLGTATGSGSSTTVALSTAATAAAGTLIVVCFGGFSGAGSATISGGSLTWTTDINAFNGQEHSHIASAYAASGLASGATLTATFAGSSVDRGICAMSFTGMQVSDTGRVDITGSSTTGSGDTWTSGAVSTSNADDLLVGFGQADGGTSTTTTPNSGWTEKHDFGDGAGETFESVYQIVAAASSYTAGGDFLTTETLSNGVIVAYKAAAGGATIVPTLPNVVDTAVARSASW